MSMNPSIAAADDRSRVGRSESIYLLVITLPLILIAITFALGFQRESAAKAHYDGIVTQLNEQGLPTDNHGSTVSFDQRLSQETSIGWLDVLVAKHELNVQFMDVRRMIIDADEMPQPGQPWEIEPIIRRYTERAEPILAAMDELVKQDQPVWQPLIWEGFDTLLPEIQESRDLTRLLATEFRHAVQQDDPERALRALNLMHGVVKAFDWHICLVADLVTMAGRSQHRLLIRQSLETGFWDDAESLQQLREQLLETDNLDSRWIQMVAGEQAMLSESLGDSFTVTGIKLFPFGVPPAARVNLLEKIRLAGEVQGVGTVEHVRAIEREIEQSTTRPNGPASGSNFTLVGLPFAYSDGPTGLLGADFAGAAEAYLRDETERRWTLTAVAIKQFQVRFDRWPDQLGELSAIGIPNSTWLMDGQTPFFYAVDHDGVTLSVTVPWHQPNVTLWSGSDQLEGNQLETRIR